MSGDRYLLDTNAVIQLFGGNRAVEQLLNAFDFFDAPCQCALSPIGNPEVVRE